MNNALIVPLYLIFNISLSYLYLIYILRVRGRARGWALVYVVIGQSVCFSST